MWIYIKSRGMFINLARVRLVKEFADETDVCFDDEVIIVNDQNDRKALRDCLSAVTIFSQLHPEEDV